MYGTSSYAISMHGMWGGGYGETASDSFAPSYSSSRHQFNRKAKYRPYKIKKKRNHKYIASQKSSRRPPKRHFATRPASELADEQPATNVHLEDTTCGMKQILKSTKKYVKREWGNRSYMGGECAYAVRRALQKSGVDSIQGGLGHAADQFYALPENGFKKLDTLDPNEAPPGSVVVFRGPRTLSRYFKTGEMRRPYGLYVGHVAIKGDDGKWYTDGKVDQPALGWQMNESGKFVNQGRGDNWRAVMGIFVPGPELEEHLCSLANRED